MICRMSSAPAPRGSSTTHSVAHCAAERSAARGGRKDGVVRPRPWRKGSAVAGDAVAGKAPCRGWRHGTERTEGWSGSGPRLTARVQRGRFSTRPGAVIRSASGTNGVATIEGDEGDEGGEQGEQRLHRDLLGSCQLVVQAKALWPVVDVTSQRAIRPPATDALASAAQVQSARQWRRCLPPSG